MDSEVLYVEGVQSVLMQKGVDVSHDEAMWIVYGKSWRNIYEDICERYGDVYPTIESMEEPLRECVNELKSRTDVKIHGSIELLRKLSQNWPVCIVSGNTRRGIKESIDEMQIGDCIKFYIGCEEYSPGKPYPACFILAAKKLGKPADECLVFEDSAAGVEAAKRAGMYAVALQRKGRPIQDMSGADEVLEDLSEFDINRWTCD